MAEELFFTIMIVAALVLSYYAGKCDFLKAMCEIFAEKSEEWETRLNRSMKDDKQDGGAET